MPEPGGAVSSLEEFWEGLEARGVEPDLLRTLKGRAARAAAPVERVGEEALVIAVASRSVPGAVPAAVLATFLDETFDSQLGRGDERVGIMPRGELIPAGFRILEEEARRRRGSSFADLPAAEQDGLLADAEAGRLEGPEGFDAGEWFRRVRDLLLLGYGSDPRGMVEMGFPGPSYAKGHVWLGEAEVARRAERARGHEEL
jgi:Gluconate 2-dehydrogenase subunit 3